MRNRKRPRLKRVQIWFIRAGGRVYRFKGLVLNPKKKRNNKLVFIEDKKTRVCIGVNLKSPLVLHYRFF